jgi:hypothetical protein
MLTLNQAIKEANKKPRNENLQYYVCKWNNGYCINSSSYMKRFPDTVYVYVTSGTYRHKI